jgi:CHAT domain-containing protein/Tfp pilus assembly protein PilF
LKTPIERKLEGAERHDYQVTLVKDQFVHILVEQRGVDVIVRLYAPGGKQLVEVDSPNGTQGPETVFAIAEEAGRYRIEVVKQDKGAAAGSYEIRLEELRAATAEDRQHVGRFAEIMLATQLSRQANDLYRKGKYSEAGPIYESALAKYEKVFGNEHPFVASALINLASAYRAQGNYVRAEPLYRRGLTIREKILGPEHPAVAAALNSLALLYSDKGEDKLAEPLYQRALAIREKVLGPEHPAVADSLHNLGFMYDNRGDYARAEPLYQRALSIREKKLGSEHPDIAADLNNLAGLYLQRGEFGRAESLYQRVLAIWEKALGPEHPYVALALNNLAGLYDSKGDYSHAEPLFQRALAIREKTLGSEHPLVALSLTTLGAHYYSRGDGVRAEPFYQRAIAIYEKVLGPEHRYTAKAINNLALLYFDRGDDARAEPLFQRALAIREKALGPEHPDVAESLHDLGLLYVRSGQPERAEPLYQRALLLWEKALGSEHPHVATILTHLALLYYRQGNYKQAVSFLRRATELRERNIISVLETGSQQQKQYYIDEFATEINYTVSLHLIDAPRDADAARLALAAALRRKGRALDTFTSQIAALRQHAVPADQALLEQLASARAQSTTLTLKGQGNSAEVKQLEDEADRLEDAISRRSAEFSAITRPVTVEGVAEALPPDMALVELVVYRPFNPKAKGGQADFGPEHYAAYVLHHNDVVPQFVDLGQAAAIDVDVVRLREALKDPRRDDVQNIARALDERIMRPIRVLLGQTRRVFLSPDGTLNLIPFAALVDEKGKYLVEKYSITYLTSGRDLMRLQAQAASLSAPTVVADPFYDLAASGHADTHAEQSSPTGDESNRPMNFERLNYTPLPGTAEEAAVLSKLWPDARVLTQERATEAALKQVNRPSILHIATHGFFLPDQPQVSSTNKTLSNETLDTLGSSPLPTGWDNPLLRSGLVLAGVKQWRSGAGEDGVLTALEIAGLNLWGTKLVVLSACETGLGDVKNGGGVYGLRRALVLSGSESQVMSLWKVSDAGTRDLMTSYYTRLQKQEGRTEALRQVQLQMLQRQLRPSAGGGKRATSDTGETLPAKDYRHPYYWAAFIQSGDWRSLEDK